MSLSPLLPSQIPSQTKFNYEGVLQLEEKCGYKGFMAIAQNVKLNGKEYTVRKYIDKNDPSLVGQSDKAILKLYENDMADMVVKMVNIGLAYNLGETKGKTNQLIKEVAISQNQSEILRKFEKEITDTKSRVIDKVLKPKLKKYDQKEKAPPPNADPTTLEKISEKKRALEILLKIYQPSNDKPPEPNKEAVQSPKNGEDNSVQSNEIPSDVQVILEEVVVDDAVENTAGKPKSEVLKGEDDDIKDATTDDKNNSELKIQNVNLVSENQAVSEEPTFGLVLEGEEIIEETGEEVIDEQPHDQKNSDLKPQDQNSISGNGASTEESTLELVLVEENEDNSGPGTEVKDNKTDERKNTELKDQETNSISEKRAVTGEPILGLTLVDEVEDSNKFPKTIPPLASMTLAQSSPPNSPRSINRSNSSENDSDKETEDEDLKTSTPPLGSIGEANEPSNKGGAIPSTSVKNAEQQDMLGLLKKEQIEKQQKDSEVEMAEALKQTPNTKSIQEEIEEALLKEREEEVQEKTTQIFEKMNNIDAKISVFTTKNLDVINNPFNYIGKDKLKFYTDIAISVKQNIADANKSIDKILSTDDALRMKFYMLRGYVADRNKLVLKMMDYSSSIEKIANESQTIKPDEYKTELKWASKLVEVAREIKTFEQSKEWVKAWNDYQLEWKSLIPEIEVY